MFDTPHYSESGTCLADAPDWRYLLREFYQVYRFSSAGGSAKIRTHQKEVRHRLSRWLERNPQMFTVEPAEKPVCVHLSRALDRAASESTAPMGRAVERIRDQLSWEYGYEKLPRGLVEKFAFTELLGPRGRVVADDLVLGLVLFAPGTTYPTHCHQGIAESYICLSGAVSENDVGVYAPGSLILNPPGHQHRVTSSDTEPCLLAYAWIGSPEALSEQKMAFSRLRTEKKS